MNQKTVFMFMGKSGSGKTTLEKNVVELHPTEFRKVISLTTRPPRDGEVHGKDYFFISIDQYKLFKSTNELVQETYFADHYYATRRMEFTTKHPNIIFTITPESAAETIPILQNYFPGIIIKVIYFNVSNSRVMQNMKLRGDTQQTILERVAFDTLDEQFKQSRLVPDFVVTDNMLNGTLTAEFVQWARTIVN